MRVCGVQIYPSAFMAFLILLLRNISRGRRLQRCICLYAIGHTSFCHYHLAFETYCKAIFKLRWHLDVQVQTCHGTWYYLLSVWIRFGSTELHRFFFWDGANRVLCLPTIYGMQNRLLFFYSDQTLAICPAFLDVWQPRQSQNFTWSCRCLTVLLLHYFLQSLEVINEQ